MSTLVVATIARTGVRGLGTASLALEFATRSVVSLPLALSCLSYFVNHCHEGVHLWEPLRGPGVRGALFATNLVR